MLGTVVIRRALRSALHVSGKNSDFRVVNSFLRMSAPRTLVLCGPSGSGKSTLLKRLMSDYPECFGFSISHTTRKPRLGETNGREYHFVDRSAMEKAIEMGEFIEFAEYSGNLYGTSNHSVKAVHDSGKMCVLDIDMQGVRSVKKIGLPAKYVFIAPPSMDVLELRLRDRGTESEESLKKRLETAKEEMLFAEKPGIFTKIIINDNVNTAYSALRDFVMEDIQHLKDH